MPRRSSVHVEPCLVPVCSKQRVKNACELSRHSLLPACAELQPRSGRVVARPGRGGNHVFVNAPSQFDEKQSAYYNVGANLSGEARCWPAGFDDDSIRRLGRGN